MESPRSPRSPDARPRGRPRTHRRARVACALLLPAGYAAQQLLGLAPELVERTYARGVQPVIARALGAVSGLVPFSLAELGLAALAAALVLGAVRTVRALRGGAPALRALGGALLSLLALAGVLHTVYLATWGLCNQRQPFAAAAGLDLAPPTPDELADLADELVRRVNRLRPGLPEDADGVSLGAGSPREVARLAGEAWERCADLHPSLGPSPAVPKLPLISPLLSRFFIQGIYSPFTAEAHVNGETPRPDAGFAICHELAHGLGFARENEANFLAWLACSRTDDPALAYSGLCEVLPRVLSALAVVDTTRVARLGKQLDPGYTRDRRSAQEFWMGELSIATDVARKVNDQYLKSQGQTAGVRTYDLIVDLVVADWRRSRLARGDGAGAARPAEPVRVAVMGGCWTAAGGAPADERWPEIARRLAAERGVPITVLDLSRCHAPAAAAFAELDDLQFLRADVLVLELGRDDLERGVPVERILEEADKVVRKARSLGVRVLVLSMLHTGSGPGAVELDHGMEELARSLRAPHVAGFLEGVGGVRGSMRADGVHPNGPGSARLAQNVLDPLLDLCARVAQDRITAQER